MQFTSSYGVISCIEKKKKNTIALRKFKEYMQACGQPQEDLRCIHIGGTNGKGSTTNDVASILIEAGYTVGMFTSPYLETHHDRIRVNGVMIPDETIVAYANAHYEAWVHYDLSMFEIDMFIATQYFLEKKVDYAIFEVGLGGLLDATNIITPMVCAITNVGLDHMEYLGDSYESIARNKAGIVKAGVALITSETKPACLAVFNDVCAEHKAALIQCESVRNVCVKDTLHFDYGDFNHIEIPTLASYQAINGALAIEIIQYVRTHKGVRVKDEHIYKGLQNAQWKGRFEVMRHEPLLILDGAHNKEGIQALISSLAMYKDVRIIFSALQDKPYKEMMSLLLELSEDVWVCEFDFYRAQEAARIGEGFDVVVEPDFKVALQRALDDKKTTVVCGSLYFISQVRHYLIEKGD